MRSNPWTKKNPLLSIWLSNANAIAGAARSRAIAEGHRQMSQMMTQGAKQVIDFWTGAAMMPTPKRKRRSRKSR